MNDFKTLGLAAPLLSALNREGYTTPTPIQAQAIPAAMVGSDILGIAQTGTGKTAAFALPILHKLQGKTRAPAKGCRVLVLSPTRELASQIAESFKTYAQDLRISVATVFGGVGHRPQIRALARGVDVLVATPGRLLDLMSTGAVSLASTEILVLDEADQMLDLGFVKPIRQIVGQTPASRQTLFFSATMPGSISALAKEFLRDPLRISVTPVSSTSERIAQRVIHLDGTRKRGLLVSLIAEHAMVRTLVFTRTKRGADKVAKYLETAGIRVAAIHGNKSQSQRERALDAFKRSKIDVLVATDIAARGIDIDDVTHVINFELPEVPEAYVHRIGRTARAGASGRAISLCDPTEIKHLVGIERLTRQQLPAERLTQDEAGAFVLVAETGRPRGAPSPDKAGRSGARGRNRNRGNRTPRDGDGRTAAPGGQRNKPKQHRRGNDKLRRSRGEPAIAAG